MTEELQKIIEDLRDKGISISDYDAEFVLNICKSKMRLCKIEKEEEYLPLLYKDEIINYIIRRTYNETSVAVFMAAKEELKDVFVM